MSRLRLTRLVAAMLAFVLVAGACSNDPPTVVVSGNDPATSAKDLAESLPAEGFTVFASLLDAVDLTTLLAADDSDKSYTVFAPTDAAFDELAPGLVELLAGEDDVVAEAPGGGDNGNAEGDSESGANVNPDTTATTIVDTDDEDTDSGDTGEGNDDEGDEPSPTSTIPSPGTTLADRPSRPEIEALLADILRNHIVEGTYLMEELTDQGTFTSLEGGQLRISSREEEPSTEGGEPTVVPTVNGVDIESTDLFATNGVIQSVDQVLVPTDRQDQLDTLAASIPVTTDVLSTLQNTGDHGQFLAALDVAGLTGQLQAGGQVTVFAPTDEAFNQLSAEAMAAFSQPEIQSAVVNYHIINRRITRNDVANTLNARTAEGESVVITKSGSDYTVNGVSIDLSIGATNGVVHVIDEVLVPNSVKGPGGF